MKDLISVIVPVYNVEKYLDKCIQSIVDQTYKNLEIILVDDGSPDNCPQMCDEWAKKDSRIKVIHKKNGGVSSARNMALDIAKGEYIGFVDSDDFIKVNMYEVLVNNMIVENLDLISCDYCKISAINECETAKIKFINVDEEINNLCSEINTFTWCKLFKSKVLNNIRFNTEITISEDVIFCIEYLLKSNKVAINTSKLYIYNTENDSSASTSFKKTNITIVKASEIILNMNLSFSHNTINYIKCKSVLYSASYILESYRRKIENNHENIKYAREIIKKYYQQIKYNKKITVKKRIMIYFAMHFTGFYAFLKRMFK